MKHAGDLWQQSHAGCHAAQADRGEQEDRQKLYKEELKLQASLSGRSHRKDDNQNLVLPNATFSRCWQMEKIKLKAPLSGRSHRKDDATFSRCWQKCR